jgi:hypothetical protein
MTEDADIIKGVVDDLHKRADRLLYAAIAFMVLIAAALVSGVWLFIYAPQFLEIPPGETSPQLESLSAISIIVSRVGAVLILLFLVQILVSLYRYNVRLVSYYRGRAYALQLMKGGVEEKFQALVTALSHPEIDFGKLPKTPAEQLERVFVQAAQAAETKVREVKPIERAAEKG